MVQGGRKGTHWTPKQHKEAQGEFLRYYKEFGQLTLAANAANISRHQVQIWEKGDHDFRLRYHDVRAEVIEGMEGNLFKLASQVPVQLAALAENKKGFSASVLRTAETATFFLLKAEKPEKYRDTYKFDREKAKADGDLSAEELQSIADTIGRGSSNVP